MNPQDNKRRMIRALLAANAQTPEGVLSQLPQAVYEDDPNHALDARQSGGQSRISVGGKYYPVGPFYGPNGPLSDEHTKMLRDNPSNTDAGFDMRRGLSDGTWPPAAPAPSILTPGGFSSFREGSLGADRSFAPGAGTRVAQNETANDAMSPEEITALAKAAGFDPESLRGMELNTTEARNLGLALRMMQAESTLRPNEQLGTKFKERALEWLPGQTMENAIYGSGMFGTDPKYQEYMNARDSFANAALRADTGATINESELPAIIQESMPLPGDTPETIALKRRTREARIRAMIAGTGAASAVLPQPGQPIIKQDEMSDEEFLKSLGLQ